MKILEHELGEGLGITEYFLQGELEAEKPTSQPNLQASQSAQIKPQIRQEKPDFEALYPNEALVRVNGKTYPFVLIEDFNTKRKQNMIIASQPYQVPQQFKKFRDAVLEQRLRPGAFDGERIGIFDLDVSGDEIRIHARKNGYFDFMAMDQGQDFYLRDVDPTFPERATLRQQEIENGKSLQPRTKNLTNMLGVGFVIRHSSGKYFIFEQRKKNLAVEGGTLGILGGTPGWVNSWSVGTSQDFNGYLQLHLIEEMDEELCLTPGEFTLQRGLWLKDLIRAVDIISYIETNVPIEEIVKRCSQSEKAKEEHASIYKIPATRQVLTALASKTRGYEMNVPSIVAINFAQLK